MNKNIAVFCSSSDAVDGHYASVATELGHAIAKNNCTLIWGGCHVGLMGHVARAAQKGGAKIIGVIPQQIKDHGLAYDGADELIVTKDLRERKALIEQKSDVVVALPGSFGTLDEVIEMITLKQLTLHQKPIVLLNVQGFYDRLHHFFEHLFDNQFAHPQYRELYHFAKDVADFFTYLRSYQPKNFLPKTLQK